MDLTASFMDLTYSATWGTLSLPYCATIFTMALPTMAPSEMAAICQRYPQTLVNVKVDSKEKKDAKEASAE